MHGHDAKSHARNPALRLLAVQPRHDRPQHPFRVAGGHIGLGRVFAAGRGHRGNLAALYAAAAHRGGADGGGGARDCGLDPAKGPAQSAGRTGHARRLRRVLPHADHRHAVVSVGRGVRLGMGGAGRCRARACRHSGPFLAKGAVAGNSDAVRNDRQSLLRGRQCRPHVVQSRFPDGHLSVGRGISRSAGLVRRPISGAAPSGGDRCGSADSAAAVTAGSRRRQCQKPRPEPRDLPLPVALHRRGDHRSRHRSRRRHRFHRACSAGARTRERRARTRPGNALVGRLRRAGVDRDGPMCPGPAGDLPHLPDRRRHGPDGRALAAGARSPAEIACPAGNGRGGDCPKAEAGRGR